MPTIINEKKTMQFPKKTVAVVVAVLAALLVIFNSFTIIDAGHTGVINTLGRVSENVLQEGLHFKIPFVQRIVKMDNRIVKLEVETEAFSKDLQTVETRLAINYRVSKDKSYAIYKNVGSDYETVLVNPAVNEVLKAITAKYTAEESVAPPSRKSRWRSSVCSRPEPKRKRPLSRRRPKPRRCASSRRRRPRPIMC